MRYIYFVVFSHAKGGQFGFGNTELVRSKPIDSADDVRAIQDTLEWENRIPNPVVLGWQLYRRLP